MLVLISSAGIGAYAKVVGSLPTQMDFQLLFYAAAFFGETKAGNPSMFTG